MQQSACTCECVHAGSVHCGECVLFTPCRSLEPHISLWKFLFQYVSIIVNTFFLKHVQICITRPAGHVNVFPWNWECFFLWHKELNSRFIVMTISEVTLNRPNIFSGFSVSFCFCRLKPFRLALKFSTESFIPYKLVSRNSWTLPHKFPVPCATWNLEKLHPFVATLDLLA